MARVHAEALSEIPEVELTGIVNERLVSAKSLAIDFGTRAFTTLKQAIRATQARGLFVCLPTPLHRAAVSKRREPGCTFSAKNRSAAACTTRPRSGDRAARHETRTGC